MDPLTPTARAALSRHVGAVRDVHPVQSATQATVVRVVGADATVIYKRPHSEAALGRERFAYQMLTPHLGAAMPTLVDEIEGGLVLSELIGARLDAAGLDDDDLREVYRHVGMLRGRLDRVPIDAAEPLPLDAALQRRFDTWCSRAGDAVDAITLQRARERFEASAFAGYPRTWCHRDLAPRNLLIERGGAGLRVFVIDFGHTRPDADLVDLLKLFEGLPEARSDRPDLVAAFEHGWGRTPDAADRERLTVLTLLYGLATAAWAHAHDDPALRAQGRSTLGRALSRGPT